MPYSDLAVRYLHEALEHIQTDRVTPVTLSTDMLSFFIDLAAGDVPHLNELGMFLTALPSGALEDALLQQATPPEHRDSILEMRNQHSVLQGQLEKELQSQRFGNAAAIRDRQREVTRRIGTILSGTQIYVTLCIVKRALQSLGWQELRSHE